MNFFRYILLLLIMFVFSGCSYISYDYSQLEKRKPRSILIIPPKNNTKEPNASYAYLSTITRPIVEKGYYVFSVALMDRFLKDNGFLTPDEMHAVPLYKLQRHTNADAVLYITINEWGKQAKLLSTKTTVSADLKLIDARTGDVLWENTAFASQRSVKDEDGTEGVIETLVGTVTEKIIGSLDGGILALSSVANEAAVNNRTHGLLPGPYVYEKPKTGWFSL